MTESDPAEALAVPQPDWTEILIAFQSGEPLKPVAIKNGVSVQKISAHARKEKWPRRSSKKSVRGTTPQTTDQLMRRLAGLVERQVAEIETRLTEASEARDHERDARTLSNLTRTLDKLVELRRDAEEEAEIKKRQARDLEMSKGEGSNADTIRADLARRLARIIAATSCSAVS